MHIPDPYTRSSLKKDKFLSVQYFHCFLRYRNMDNTFYCTKCRIQSRIRGFRIREGLFRLRIRPCQKVPDPGTQITLHFFVCLASWCNYGTYQCLSVCIPYCLSLVSSNALSSDTNHSFDTASRKNSFVVNSGTLQAATFVSKTNTKKEGIAINFLLIF